MSRGAIGYTLGYEHSPWQFIKSKLVKDRSPLGENCFELQPHESVEFTLDSYEYEGSMERDIHAAIQEVYYRYRQEPRIVSDPITAVSDLARAVGRDAWLPEEFAYSGQVFEHKESGGYRYNPILSLSCLEHMRDAICYEFSFKFGYNSPIKVPPLSRIGWSSCGGSVTSTANPHIHPMGSNLVGELLYYLDNCEDDYIRDWLEDTIRWGCQTYNTYDKEYGYGKKGWMSERFCHSDGLLTQTYDDGTIASTWFCLMPWASSCIIEGLSGEYWEKNGTLLRSKTEYIG